MSPYFRTGIIPKPVQWLADGPARYQAGIELFALQLGANPTDWKPMRSIGAGASEIRIHAENEYRVIYVAKFEEAVYVLHAFMKKTRETSLHDVRLAQRRYREMIALRGTK